MNHLLLHYTAINTFTAKCRCSSWNKKPRRLDSLFTHRKKFQRFIRLLHPSLHSYRSSLGSLTVAWNIFVFRHPLLPPSSHVWCINYVSLPLHPNPTRRHICANLSVTTCRGVLTGESTIRSLCILVLTMFFSVHHAMATQNTF